MNEGDSEQKTEWVEDWKEMKKFGDWLFQHGESCASKKELDYTDKIFEQRVALVLVHQAAEILLKSYLVKELGDSSIIDGSQRNHGRDKTITFMKAVRKAKAELVKKEISIDEKPFETFNEKRNEISHRALKITWDKDVEITRFKKEFKKFYDKAFNEDLDTTPRLAVTKFKKIHT